jgi:pyruvate-formate lyase-activating enzyme
LDALAQKTPQDAFAQILVANIWMRRQDPRLPNLCWVFNVPVAVDHDLACYYDPFIHYYDKNDFKVFLLYFFQHWLVHTVNYSTGKQYSILEDVKPGKSSKPEFPDILAASFHNLKEITHDFGHGLIAAEYLTLERIRAAVLAFKGIEEIEKLVLQAGYSDEAERRKMTAFLIAAQATLGRDVGQMWEVLTGDSGNFAELDTASSPAHGMRGEVSVIGLAREDALENLSHYRRIEVRSLPPVIDWLITEQCNRECAGCWLNSSPRAPPSRLTLEQHKFLVNYLYENGVRSIGPSGGEPFMVPHIIELLIYCRSKPGLQVNFYTNGVLLERDFNRVIPLVDLLSLSLDGHTPEKNAILRGGHLSDFDCVVRLIECFKVLGKKCMLQIITVISRMNANDIEDIGALLDSKAHYIPHFRWKINYNFPYGRGRALLPELPYEEFEALAKKAQQKYPRLNIQYSPEMVN